MTKVTRKVGETFAKPYVPVPGEQTSQSQGGGNALTSKLIRVQALEPCQSEKTEKKTQPKSSNNLTVRQMLKQMRELDQRITAPKRKTSYSTEFKRIAVEMSFTMSSSIEEIAKALNIPPLTLFSWLHQYFAGKLEPLEPIFKSGEQSEKTHPQKEAMKKAMQMALEHTARDMNVSVATARDVLFRDSSG